MKKVTVLLMVCLVSLSVYSQKVDLDRQYIKIKYTNLPTAPIQDEDFRTYSVKANDNDVVNKIKLYGFEKLNNEGTVNVDITIGNVIVNGVEISKREKVNKNKEGKVTSTERYYTPVITYTTSGRYKVENSQGEPYSYTLGNKKTHKGNEYNSYAKASNYYKNNSINLKDKFQREFISNSTYQINKGLNNRYGYEPYVANELFWILDSKKNDDYEGHNKALADMKTVLAKFSHDSPLDELQKELKSLVAYFESVVPKYPEDKNKHRKMKYASYYNIAHLYYHFDMPNKAIEYANKLIENDYDKSDGKKLIKRVDKLKELFETNEVTSRHFEVVTVDNSTQETVSNDVASVSSEVPMVEKYIETIFTNADGSKVEGKLKLKLTDDVDVSKLDLTKYFKNSVKVYTLDDDGNAKSKNYFARQNASYIVNGSEYAAVKFNSNSSESQGNAVGLDGAKFYFAKILYKSDKISLYKYKNEFVLFKAGEKKAQSTSSLAFSISFKKKLAKLVDDCPDLVSLAKEGSFSNTEESLIAFVQEYKDGCK